MARQNEWKDNLISVGLATGAGTFESLVANFTEPDKRGMTLVRTLIRLTAFSTSIAGAYGVQNISMGIGVASQEAFAVGLAALSDPQTESDKPTRGWVWCSQMLVSQNGVGGEVLQTITADIRGMRKLENGELFVSIFNVAEVGTAFGIEMHGIIRTLFKLP